MSPKQYNVLIMLAFVTLFTFIGCDEPSELQEPQPQLSLQKWTLKTGQLVSINSA